MIFDIIYIIDDLFNFITGYFIKNQNEVIDNLWLGNYISSHDINFLNDKKIELIINMTKEIEFPNLEINKIRISMNDNFSEVNSKILLESFNNNFQIIDGYITNNKGVLIHCRQGMQRSATFTALYLMKKYKISWIEAKEIIRQKRSIAFFPFPIFNSILQNFNT